MAHGAVVDFLKSKVEGLGDDVKFGYGRATDFNQIKDKKYPYVWCDPLTSTIAVTEESLLSVEVYNVSLVFYKYDRADSTEEQYKLILNETDTLVRQFLRDIHEDFTDDVSESVRSANTRIENISKEPVIKVMADVLTGWIVRFTLTVPDAFTC